MTSGTTHVRLGFWFATAAVLSAAGFTVWALTATVYSSGETILEANPEASVRIAIAVPIAVTVAVWLLLHMACRHDLERARVAASVIAWAVFAFAIVTGFSIGMYVMPLAIMLIAAAQFTPVTRR